MNFNFRYLIYLFLGVLSLTLIIQSLSTESLERTLIAQLADSKCHITFKTSVVDIGNNVCLFTMDVDVESLDPEYDNFKVTKRLMFPTCKEAHKVYADFVVNSTYVCTYYQSPFGAPIQAAGIEIGIHLQYNESIRISRQQIGGLYVPIVVLCIVAAGVIFEVGFTVYNLCKVRGGYQLVV